jgi:hypothetical protein
MAFGEFKSLGEVALKYQITLRSEAFVQPIPLELPTALKDRLNFFREQAPFEASEAAICEFLIAPVLQELWVRYADALTLWSHAHFGDEPPLQGFPDYFFSRRSPLGRVMDQPYVLFIEAKNEQFDLAWGQCLAAMLAAQQVNHHKEQPILGGVSSGEVWYFGKLVQTTLIRDLRLFSLGRFDELAAALNYVFTEAKRLVQQLESRP